MSHLDADHPIIDRPWEYRIQRLVVETNPDNQLNDVAELVLQRGVSIRRLRFEGVRSLAIEEGGLQSASLRILDVSSRQLDRLNVWVTDFEPQPGISFWARKVTDLDRP